MSPLIKWSPILEPFEDMDKMFSDFLPSLRGRASQAMFSPAVDMYDNGDNIVVETQLAGVDPEKVDISIENDVLTIKGESEKKKRSKRRTITVRRSTPEDSTAR